MFIANLPLSCAFSQYPVSINFKTLLGNTVYIHKCTHMHSHVCLELLIHLKYNQVLQLFLY